MHIAKKLRNRLFGSYYCDVELLVRQGLKLGKNVSIQPMVIIDPCHCWLIEIDDDVTIAPRAYFYPIMQVVFIEKPHELVVYI